MTKEEIQKRANEIFPDITQYGISIYSFEKARKLYSAGAEWATFKKESIENDIEVNVTSTARIDLNAKVPTVIVTIEILNVSKKNLIINTEGKSMPVAYTDTLTIERKIEL